MDLRSKFSLKNKTILITGAARRIGRALSLACAHAGANIVLHYHDSEEQAAEVGREIKKAGRQVWLIEGDLSEPEAVIELANRASEAGPLFGLVNNAAIFGSQSFQATTRTDWERHLAVNLEAPFLLSQFFAAQVPPEGDGRIVNLLDWRALRPAGDHFAYTVSKAALAGMTQALAAALAPRITVNGLALGAILPPSDHAAASDILKNVPAGRWGGLPEVESALLFLLAGPAYITGEVLHVDGGRHLI